MPAADPPLLKWRGLPADARFDLHQKISGLYGHTGDAAAFDALELDKQQALLIFVSRLHRLRLWGTVRRVVNVYGTSGVGMSFIAWPSISAALTGRRDFTKMWARHRGSLEGFRERHRDRAALHFLREGDGAPDYLWSAHFDWHNPLSSAAGAWRHLFQEKWRAANPDWRAIKRELDVS